MSKGQLYRVDLKKREIRKYKEIAIKMVGYIRNKIVFVNICFLHFLLLFDNSLLVNYLEPNN